MKHVQGQKGIKNCTDWNRFTGNTCERATRSGPNHKTAPRRHDEWRQQVRRIWCARYFLFSGSFQHFYFIPAHFQIKRSMWASVSLKLKTDFLSPEKIRFRSPRYLTSLGNTFSVVWGGGTGRGSSHLTSMRDVFDVTMIVWNPLMSFFFFYPTQLLVGWLCSEKGGDGSFHTSWKPSVPPLQEVNPGVLSGGLFILLKQSWSKSCPW